MNKVFKYIFIFIVAISFFIPKIGLAEERDITMFFFYGDGCPHCAEEEVFIEKLEKEYKNFEVVSFEVWKNRKNSKLLAEVSRKLDIKVSGVPVTIIGSQYIIGFNSENTTGEQIKNIIDQYLISGYVDIITPLIEGKEDPIDNIVNTNISNSINIPFLGELEMNKLSLPVLTILIAGLDGFNPCAMWILLFLISLLLGMKNRKRMFILGFAFIFASGFVYFLFLSAWLNLFLFLSFVYWLKILIAAIAIFSGVYHLREYWKNRNGTCHIIEKEKRERVFGRLKKIVQKKNFFIAIVGIVLLAAAVNLVELFCSAGLPAIYTQVLALSDLNPVQHYSYLLLYVIVFMLDDLLIFIIAMTTLRMKALSSKYTRWSNLVGGILMIIIGLLLIFKPSFLMFG